jgi:sigma-B regulation protein RsbU (phosphoserine phosphatase)
MSEKRTEKESPLSKLYRLYLSGLNINDFERLVKKEVPGIYQYYREQITPPEPGTDKLKRSFLFLKDFFIVFLNKLTPVRRIVYSVSLFLFIWGYFIGSYFYLVLGFIITNLLLAFELADKLSMRDELEVAKKIQQDLMPPSPPQIERFEIASYISPAREVGGDYYDFIRRGENGQHLFVIGDISGKGMAAALNMIQVRTLIHVLASAKDDMPRLLENLNRELYRVFRREYFFTANVAAFTRDNRLSFCRAGHLPVIYYSAKNKETKVYKPRGLGLGLTGTSLFAETLEVVNIETAEGDVLLFYTDGVSECMNEHGEFFGDERLHKIIHHNAHRPAEQIKRDITYRLADFAGETDQHDDVTFVVFKVR